MVLNNKHFPSFKLGINTALSHKVKKKKSAVRTVEENGELQRRFSWMSVESGIYPTSMKYLHVRLGGGSEHGWEEENWSYFNYISQMTVNIYILTKGQVEEKKLRYMIYEFKLPSGDIQMSLKKKATFQHKSIQV